MPKDCRHFNQAVQSSIKLSVRLILPLFLTWLITSAVIVYRLQTLGAFASVSATKTLNYLKTHTQLDPGNLRLNQSYKQWALSLNMTDPANYIKVGLGIVDGKGVNLKNLSPENHDYPTYMPYYFQAPGTAIIIGLMIKLFGAGSIVPYFILIFFVHWLTALLTCLLASRFINDYRYILGAGMLSLLCLPVLDFDFAMGIFSSEPLVAPFIVTSLIALSIFWTTLQKNSPAYKKMVFAGLGFGAALGIAAYFRDIYATFAQFCLLVLIFVSIVKRRGFKQTFLFALIAIVTLSAIEYPWEKRNKRYFGEFTMSGSTYNGYGLWHAVWDDYGGSRQWGWNDGVGLGFYLAPEKSAEIIAVLNKDKKAGSLYALQCLARAVCKKPWPTICYKLKIYDTLWFGQRCHYAIYLWSLLSTISFFVFLYLTRFQFIPEIWLFPLFMLCLSPLIHYEHRYTQPFFLFITPITAMYVLKYFLKDSISPKENQQTSATIVSLIKPD